MYQVKLYLTNYQAKEKMMQQIRMIRTQEEIFNQVFHHGEAH